MPQFRLRLPRGEFRVRARCLSTTAPARRPRPHSRLLQCKRRTPSSDMKCPFCGFENDKVVDSRESKEADSIRRRRECLKCGKRFTTYERIDEIPYMVVKKDGRREKFDRQKVLNGLLRACEKRPVPISRLEQIVNEAEGFVIESAERERKTSEVGELIMNRLRRYDKVAYVRFASVYLDFKDVQEFMAELKDLLKTKEVPEVRKGGAVKS
jgi:transcriptional repressor NrdR